jgi:hypothetical protein
MYEGKKAKNGVATITVTNGKGLNYDFSIHNPVKGRPWSGFSLGDSPVYPLSDIPYIVEALMGIYVTALDSVNVAEKAKAQAEEKDAKIG